MFTVTDEDVFAYEEENLTLPCISTGEVAGKVHWQTWIGIVKQDNGHLQKSMYMLNGSQTGNYSLIISSVSEQHSGVYKCMGLYPIRKMYVYVCTQFSSLDVTFSHGESVPLEGNFTAKFSLKVRWYRQKALEPQVMILHSHDQSVLLPKDLRGRVSELKQHTNYSLIISNLTAEDSGAYTWRVTEMAEPLAARADGGGKE